MHRHRVVTALIAIALLVPGLAAADYNAEYRKSCKVLAKYRLKVWAGCIADRSVGVKDLDTGCSYAESYASSSCASGVGVASMRIGSSPYNNSYSKRAGWWSQADGPPVSDPYAGRSTRSTFIPNVAFDSLARTITVTFDSLKLVASNDSSFTLIDLKAWVADGDLDSTITPAKTYWSGTVIVQAGSLHTEGGFAPSDFMLGQDADSSWVSAAHLVKVIPLAPGPDFENVVLQMIGDGGFGTAVLPPPTPMPMNTPLLLGAMVLLLAGTSVAARRSGTAPPSTPTSANPAH